MKKKTEKQVDKEMAESKEFALLIVETLSSELESKLEDAIKEKFPDLEEVTPQKVRIIRQAIAGHWARQTGWILS